MDYTKLSCEEFVTLLASKAAVPGGGGASALVGALGISLGSMVANLTIGKKKYAAVEADVIALNEKARTLQKDFMALIEEDAKAFEPLSKAYGLPKETEEEKNERARIMEEALVCASLTPLKMMEKCCEALLLHQEFAQKGSALAISDVGVGAVLCKAALQGASLNVFINTKMMLNREKAEELNAKARQMLDEYLPMADAIFAQVSARFA